MNVRENPVLTKVSDRTHKALKELVASEGRTISDFVRWLIERELKQRSLTASGN